ncbi:uncharacterized protein LOC144713743 [Wolffia australiana]
MLFTRRFSKSRRCDHDRGDEHLHTPLHSLVTRGYGMIPSSPTCNQSNKQTQEQSDNYREAHRCGISYATTMASNRVIMEKGHQCKISKATAIASVCNFPIRIARSISHNNLSEQHI